MKKYIERFQVENIDIETCKREMRLVTSNDCVLVNELITLIIESTVHLTSLQTGGTSMADWRTK